MVENALQEWDLNQLDFLFIENVGNLVCPSSYDLGENLRLVLISVTEGEDKPLKYPTILTAPMLPWSAKLTWRRRSNSIGQLRIGNVQAVRPGMLVFKTFREERRGNGGAPRFSQKAFA